MGLKTTHTNICDDPVLKLDIGSEKAERLVRTRKLLMIVKSFEVKNTQIDPLDAMGPPLIPSKYCYLKKGHFIYHSVVIKS